MKGVILAGGSGLQCHPASKVTNKHLFPVYDKPMIFYAIETLKESGVTDILVIVGTEFSGDFIELLGAGGVLDVNLTYKVQPANDGAVKALALAEDFVGGDTMAVIFADNVFEENFSETAFYFQKGARIFVKKVENPSDFGVVELREDKTVRSIEEKPSFPKSGLVQTGLFLYDEQVFNFIKDLQPDEKGIIGITDLNKYYLSQKLLKAEEVEGMWIDAGTHEGILEAAILVQEGFNPVPKKVKKSNKETVSVLPKVTVGITVYNSAAYIEPCLQSLVAQDYQNMEIVILDNNSTDASVSIIKSKFPEIKIIQSNENLGFSKAHNQLITETDGEFYACFNADMIFESSFITELMQPMLENPSYGSVGGKIKRWDFASIGDKDKGKTNFIDSVGIRIMKTHQFEDIGQGDVDFGQFDQPRDIFGISGAAVLLRREALIDTAFPNPITNQLEYFDESMFIYKEDVDLAYRFQWAGWKSRFTPTAIAYHDRTTSSVGQRAVNLIKNRSEKNGAINRVSYLNHQILLEKNFSSNFSTGVKLATSWFNLKVFFFLLIFETETLGQWWKFFRLKKRLKGQQKNMKRRISQVEIEKFMEG